MNSRQFLETKLNELHSRFNEVQIRYEYRANTNSHIIEVIPLSFFEDNEEYMNVEAGIEEEFESSFPNENILFVSEDSLTEIKSPILEWGYELIKFDNEVFNLEFVVEGFSECVEFQDSNNYALAA
ncbi:hypothetical protein SAMN06265379_107109 [Saccharicrinis carchari]|uniref:Uncharacterized protein n=1 Tax=Saccharicrinis carchari TaxID=1168039 RepID=A0A521E130_SACCC|nr:hypothetical protein [Saccharicrinis carchari]SMO77669.1 hypothetical protein SAMN06265379_107109 [Saccharicrinis carchari]